MKSFNHHEDNYRSIKISKEIEYKTKRLLHNWDRSQEDELKNELEAIVQAFLATDNKAKTTAELAEIMLDLGLIDIDGSSNK